MNLPFKEKIRRADRDNCINLYIGDEAEDILSDGAWQQFFTEQPEPLTRGEPILTGWSIWRSARAGRLCRGRADDPLVLGRGGRADGWQVSLLRPGQRGAIIEGSKAFSPSI